MLCIVVLTQGFVRIGEVTESMDLVQITGSRTIMRWGSARGLEQIANDGPTRETQLSDKLKNPCRVHRLAVVQMLICDEKAWEGKW